MTTISHQSYVISDLHLGGRFPECGGNRGFRMMDRPDALASFVRALADKPATPTTELVINGDFLDFLAEESSDDEWKAFRDEPGEAVLAFDVLAGRQQDGAVFDALGAFLDAGHRLTILTGNHDLELTWPEVREAFERRLWKTKKTRAFNLRWILDGEALVIGDALIEHGNRYDPANFVDHGRLRRVRELRSRQLHTREEGVFLPPVGSRLVAEVMNPIKKDFPFIDLLKPESEPLFALLLALDPSQRGRLAALVGILADIPLNLDGPPADPDYRQRIASTAAHRGPIAGGMMTDSDRAMAELVSRMLPGGEATDAAGMVATIPVVTDEITRAPIASLADRAAAAWSLLCLVVAKNNDDIDKRLPLLRAAVRALRGDRTFDEGVETGRRYLNAARYLAKGRAGRTGFRFVIFGHTHHRKRVDLLEEGATYINTGTWARVMKFPEKLVSGDDAVARAELTKFVLSIQDGSYQTDFVPTFARIDLRDDGYVERVELETYDPSIGRID